MLAASGRLYGPRPGPGPDRRLYPAPPGEGGASSARPRTRANSSPLWVYSQRNAWANWRLLGQPNTILPRSSTTFPAATSATLPTTAATRSVGEAAAALPSRPASPRCFFPMHHLRARATLTNKLGTYGPSQRCGESLSTAADDGRAHRERWPGPRPQRSAARRRSSTSRTRAPTAPPSPRAVAPSRRRPQCLPCGESRFQYTERRPKL